MSELVRLLLIILGGVFNSAVKQSSSNAVFELLFLLSASQGQQ